MPEDTLSAALAAFQADLPRIGKGNLAVVRSDKGSYKYTYADLSDVSAVVLPAIARHGLSFSAKPTLNNEGRFVLEYVLRHTSGEHDHGQYPLPPTGTPQQIGSAITYARRYALSAVTGIVPDEDDDGQAAEQAPPDLQDGFGQRVTPSAEARDELRAVCEKLQLDLNEVAAAYQRIHQLDVRHEDDAARIHAFAEILTKNPQKVLDMPGEVK